MTEFGKQLRFWRKNKGLSQLDLALYADVSNKHISFLETGRAKPSREMIILLANTLDISLRSRNDLLNSAGFSDGYSQGNIDDEQMSKILHSLNLILKHHEPYPALAFDWHWNIIMANAGFQKIVELVTSINPNFTSSRNIIELTFDPNGFKPFIKNWDEVASMLVQRLHRERLECNDRHTELLEDILGNSTVPSNWRELDLSYAPSPTLNVQLQINELEITLFSVLSSFGTPIDVTAEEITIEQYFPADDATRKLFDMQ